MWCCLLLDKYKVSNSGWVVCLMNCRASVMWRSILPVLPDFEKIFLSNYNKDGRLWWPDSKEEGSKCLWNKLVPPRIMVFLLVGQARENFNFGQAKQKRAYSCEWLSIVS